MQNNAIDSVQNFKGSQLRLIFRLNRVKKV